MTIEERLKRIAGSGALEQIEASPVVGKTLPSSTDGVKQNAPLNLHKNPASSVGLRLKQGETDLPWR